MDEPRPLILTLELDDASFSFFDGLRRTHFPPARNVLPAHLTLFHHLPGDEEAAIRDALAEIAASTAPMTVRVTGLRFLGRGVAFALESGELAALRAEIARRWWDRLTAQDRQPFRPHVTVQNKAEPAAARALLRELEATFETFGVTGTGLHLWRYLGPAWEPVELFPFGGGVDGEATPPRPSS